MDFTLRVVPLAQVLPHESHEEKRVADLVQRLVADGRLINPPIVADWQGSYVLLDGATRAAAFRTLGYQHIVSQVIDPLRPDLQLHTWVHGVRGQSLSDLLTRLRGLPGLEWHAISPETMETMLLAADTIACLLGRDGTAYHVSCSRDPSAAGLPQDLRWLEVFNRFVEAYMAWGVVVRSAALDPEGLGRQFTDLVALVVFADFSVPHLLDIAVSGRYIPAGITRFVIPGRVLRLNIPLERLTGSASLQEKNDWLDRLLQEKTQGRQVRYYQEPVILFDE